MRNERLLFELNLLAGNWRPVILSEFCAIPGQANPLCSLPQTFVRLFYRYSPSAVFHILRPLLPVFLPHPENYEFAEPRERIVRGAPDESIFRTL